MMFWIFLAAQLTSATPIPPVDWFDNLNWEQLVSQKGGHALTFIRVTVTPQGSPQDCTVEVPSGIPKLDAMACEAVMQRGHFRPARGADGRPAYGIYRKDLLWADLDSFHYSRPVDIEIDVDHLPKGTRSPLGLSVDFAVGADGSKSSCKAPAVDNALVSIACKQLLDSYPAVPAHDASGAPVASIQNVEIGFVVKKP